MSSPFLNLGVQDTGFTAIGLNVRNFLGTRQACLKNYPRGLRAEFGELPKISNCPP